VVVHPVAPPVGNRLADGFVSLNATSPCAIRKHFTLRIHSRNRVHITSAEIFVNRKRVRALHGRALHRRFRLTHLPKGKFRLRVVIHGIKHGRRITIRDSRSYSRCKHKRGKNRHHAHGSPGTSR
jgi:hypothetical protein